MKIENVRVVDLIPYEHNTKIHDKQQIDNVAESIRRFGFVQPVVVDDYNVIVIGHARTLARKKLGMKEVPCVRVSDLTDEEIRLLRIADNKTNESPWDFGELNIELEGLDLSGFKFDFNIEDRKTDGHIDVEEYEYDYSEDIPKRVSIGDVWQLGDHRLVCGSSTEDADVAKLMNGEKARVLFTSPPYSDIREYNGGKDLTVGNIARFIRTYRPFVDHQCVNLGIQRKDKEVFQYWDEYIAVARECGYKLLSWNVWDKGSAGSIGQQIAMFPIRHEWIFVFGTEPYELNRTWERLDEKSKNKNKPRKVRQPDGSMKVTSNGDSSYDNKKMESVLRVGSERGSIRHYHPATFPVELPSEYIQAMTNKGDIVIEPFGGSGTTLIACEDLGRKCRIMELDEKYCDLIIDRWEKATGRKAVKL